LRPVQKALLRPWAIGIAFDASSLAHRGVL
jgi:hypothetical protein